MVTLQELREMILTVFVDNKTHTRQELIACAEKKYEMTFYDADQRTSSALQSLIKKGELNRLENGVYQLQSLNQSTTATMNKQIFWDIIDRVNAEVDRNEQKAVLAATEKQLMHYPAEDIARWHEIKRVYMDVAYRNDLWAACAATESHCTDDGFIDFRSWLISQGKEIYMAALHNPDSLADLDIPAGSADFELYGYVAYDAYALKKAIEIEGIASVLQKCCRFSADNSAQIFERCAQHPMMEHDKYQRLKQSFARALSKEYDIWKQIKNRPISKAVTSDILAEIHLKPDIDAKWSHMDLPNIVPHLHKKYSEMQAQQGMKFY